MSESQNENAEDVVESIKNTDETEDIEFDDNIDIDAIQEQLQLHMEEEGVNYEPAPSAPKLEPEVMDAESNALVPASEDEEPADNDLEIESFVKSVTDDSESVENSEDSDIAEFSNFSGAEPKKDEEKPKLQLGEKKYVIYIEPDNVDFIEAMTIKERKKIINRLLKEEDTVLKKRKLMHERAKFVNQVIIMVVTVVVSLPIFFVLLNKSIEVTILNYQQSQQNFIKLYKEQGKISSYKNFKKKF